MPLQIQIDFNNFVVVSFVVIITIYHPYYCCCCECYSYLYFVIIS